MKILIIAPRFHTNLYYRIKAWQDADHKVAMLAQYKGGSECYDILSPKVIGHSHVYNFLEKLRYKITKKRASDIWKLLLAWPTLKVLKKEILNSGADIIAVKGMKSIFAFLTFYYAKKLKKDVFVLIQTNVYYEDRAQKKFSLFLLKKVFKVKAIISPLKNIADKEDSYFKYIPFIIETKNFEKQYFANDRVNILDIGKFVRNKDHLVLLSAINKLKNKYNLFLTIIGETRDKVFQSEILEYIKKNKLLNIVNIKYNLPYKNILELYKKYDLYILPSYDEPAAYSMLEAMANKLPAICSDTNGTKCYIKPGENGYIFQSKNVDDLVSKIEEIIKNKENLIKMGEKSYEIVKNYHSPEFFVKEFDNLLKK